MRAIIMISPNNPTGSVVTDAELDAMASLAREHDLALISDEVFADYPISGHTAGQRASPADGADVRARRAVEIRRPSSGEAWLDCRRRSRRRSSRMRWSGSRRSATPICRSRRRCRSRHLTC